MTENNENEVMTLSMRYEFISRVLTNDARQTGELYPNQRVIIKDVIQDNPAEGIIDFHIEIQEEAIH